MPTYTDLRDGSGLNGSGSESVNYDVDPGDSWTDASDAESQLSWDLSSDEQHDEESCEIVTDVLKRRILKSLSTVKAKSAYGSFAFSETLPYAVNPGLDINGIGAIGLPLSERDATTITKACHKAPFGKGGDTIVDPLVRNTWELNADQFELKNPAWGGFLQKVVEKTGKELGVAGGGRGIRAELYKLLLYEEGAMFKPHQEYENFTLLKTTEG
ncbi:MAG: hypothetical protein M1837_003435 [Sclerophora amabilis]|nr:MAG: hypothetical protein M1837_003435 [Sclerophora amabilis]